MTISREALSILGTNLPAYCRACLRIRTKGGFDHDSKRVVMPESAALVLNEEQAILNDLCRSQYERTGRIRIIILKARQVGMSTITAARFFRKMHLWPNHRALVIADETSRSEILFSMYTHFLDNLPSEIAPMVRWTNRKQEFFLDNPSDKRRKGDPGLGSGISVETANDTSAGRGATYHLVHCSEIASWADAATTYLSLMQSVPDYGSEVILESTAKGVGNLFHQQWLAAEEGEGLTEGSNGYLAVFFPWWQHKTYSLPVDDEQREHILATLDDLETIYLTDGVNYRGDHHVLTLEQLLWRRKTIEEKCMGDLRLFQQEYPATPEEAFIVSGENFFDQDALRIYLTNIKKPKKRCTLTEITGGGIFPSMSPLGSLKIWEEPREDATYIISADTATGKRASGDSRVSNDPDQLLGGLDFSVADVIDVENRRQVAQFRARVAPEVFARQVYLMGHWYSSTTPWGSREAALVAPERNHSSGETVIGLLQKWLYPNIYRHRAHARRRRKPTDTLGWVTNLDTRMPMLDNLGELVRDRALEIPCRETVQEMLTFIRNEEGKPLAQEGAHDDTVISIGIGSFLMVNFRTGKPKNFERKQTPFVGTSPTGMYDY